MRITLNHDEVMEAIQDKLQGAVEDFVRGQISIADGQELTVELTNNGGLFGAVVGVQLIKGAAPTKTEAAPPKTPVRRQTKAERPTLVPDAPAPETQVVTNGSAPEYTGRAITDTPEDRQPVTQEQPAPTEEADLPKPAKAGSIFAKARQAAEAEAANQDAPTQGTEEEFPVREALGEAPAPEPERKSIFSFKKSGAA